MTVTKQDVEPSTKSRHFGAYWRVSRASGSCLIARWFDVYSLNTAAWMSMNRTAALASVQAIELHITIS